MEVCTDSLMRNCRANGKKDDQMGLYVKQELGLNSFSLLSPDHQNEVATNPTYKIDEIGLAGCRSSDLSTFYKESPREQPRRSRRERGGGGRGERSWRVPLDPPQVISDGRCKLTVMVNL